jgi:hypothetical protein
MLIDSGVPTVDKEPIDSQHGNDINPETWYEPLNS